MNSNAFPLLHLPYNVQMETIRSMDLYEQCAFSVCSKATKSLVKSLNTKNLLMEVEIGNSIIIFVGKKSLITDRPLELHFYDNENEEKLRTPFGPFFILVADGIRTIDWKKFSKFNEIREWIKHFMDVFNILKINQLFISIERVILDITKCCMDGFTYADLYIFYDIDNTPDENCLKITNHLLPRKQLKISKWGDASLINPKVLNQNISMLTGVVGFKITLNSLLLANSEYMELAAENLSTKDVNRFLKLWMSGCNPRMKYLLLWEYNSKSMEILKGIEFKHVPDDVQRKYPLSFKYFSRGIIKGGFDIIRKDGTVATVHFGMHGLEIFVWN